MDHDPPPYDTAPNGLDVGKLVRIYLKMREKKAALEAEIKKIDSAQDVVEAALLAEAKAQGVTSFGTQYGTVIRTARTRMYSTDMSAFRAFVVAHNCADLFESRLSQGNVKAWLDEHPDKVPPGLQADTKESISIRKTN